MDNTITSNEKETRLFGKKLAKRLKGGGVICLYGDLGAGKTTLVQGIAEGLGIDRRINSPTFIIVRKYDDFWHIDLYRLKSLEEARAVGIEEILSDPKNVVAIEWPEVIQDILPKHHIEVRINIVGQKREINEIIY